MVFKDRKEAGILLADKLSSHGNRDAVVYALPRGGVVVGAEISKKLKIPLNVAVVKKIGHPFNPEYAICAISEDGSIVCSEDERRRIGSEWFLEALDSSKREVASRREEYEKVIKSVSPEGKAVLLVDDGVATGLTMKAAIAWAKNQKAEKIIVAVPVIPKETAGEIKKEIDDLVALEAPEYFMGAVGEYYINFEQVTGEEVKELLSQKYE